MRISIGPVLYLWARETLEDFYRQSLDSPAEIIYLGETVCSKRRSFRPEDWIELGRELTAAGKSVALSTLTLIESRAEIGVIKRLCGNGELHVEANDLAAAHLLAEQGLPFTAGPAINVYNAHTLKTLRRLGLSRWVMPFELSRADLAAILADAETLGLRDGLEVEVFSYGRIPLAYSARCFTARHHNLPKDQCELICGQDPEGMPLLTQEGKPFLTINGIQTQSGLIYDLRSEWEDMQALGVDIMRISPRPEGTMQRVRELHEAITQAKPLPAPDPLSCNGYWYGDPGMDLRADAG